MFESLSKVRTPPEEGQELAHGLSVVLESVTNIGTGNGEEESVHFLLA